MTVSLENNYWNGKSASEAVDQVNNKDNTPASTGVVAGTFPINILDAYKGNSSDAVISYSSNMNISSDNLYTLGEANIANVLKSQKTVSLVSGSALSNVPEGVTIKNETGKEITVNGKKVAANSSITIASASTDTGSSSATDDYLIPV